MKRLFSVALVDQQVQSPRAFATVFFAIYVLVAALSIPGAAIMTLAAAALFGLGIASTTGATLAFLASRHLLRDHAWQRN